MMRNLAIFCVLAVSSGLLENAVFGYPDLRMKQEVHPGCPKTDEGLATLLPHESECTAYYMCQSGVGILKRCPHNLHFNAKKRVCDFPDRAGCQTGEEEKEEEEDILWSDGSPHPDCPSKDPSEPVLLPHESDCSKFYICQRAMAYEKACMFELHFNPRLQVCDYPENVKCAHRFSEQREAEQPKCPKQNKSTATLLPHERDCTLYYICDSGKAILRDCPDGLHFNPKKLVCDFSERAGCQKDELSVQLAQPEATGSPSPYCPTINGKYPIFFGHPTNCSVYYMCSNGSAYEFTCPSKLHFNIRLKVCDFPWRAQCKKTELYAF